MNTNSLLVSVRAGNPNHSGQRKHKITSIYPGGMHPFHLINVKGDRSTVYGWVDAGSIV